MSQLDKLKSLKTTRIIFAVGFVISILLSMGLIALGWFGYSSFTAPLIGGFLLALLASFFLKGKYANMIAWVFFVVGTIISIMLLMAAGGLAG